MNRKIIISFLLAISIGYIYFNNVSSGAVEKNNIDKLEELSNSIYESVQIKDYENAKLMVEELADIFPNLDYKGLTNVEGIRALSESIINTKKALANIRPDDDAIFNNVTQLRLGIDALLHKKQPLWKRYDTVIEQDIKQIRKSYEIKDNNKLQQSIKQLQLHYNLIRPALMVSGEFLLVNKINSLITALISQVDYENYQDLITELQNNFQQLFYGADMNVIGGISSKAIILQVSIGISIIILITLSYVVMRKFRATRY